MMAKGAPITMRLREETRALVESMPGDSFTQKFELIVNDYFMTIPVRQEQLAEIERQIKDRTKKLKKLMDLESRMGTMVTLAQTLQADAYKLEKQFATELNS